MIRKYLYLTTAAICLALAADIVVFFQAEGKWLLTVSVLIAVALLASIVFLRKLFFSIDEKLAMMTDKHSADIAALRARLEKSEEIRARYREIVTQCENCPKVIVKDSIKLKYFDAFRNNVVIPYLEGLKRVNMPLSPEDKQEILDQTIELAMQAVDIADAAEWTINNRSEQKLNLDIVSKSKTRDDAYEEAIIITDNPAATPKWIRALSSSIIDVVSDSCKIIFSGYRR